MTHIFILVQIKGSYVQLLISSNKEIHSITNKYHITIR